MKLKQLSDKQALTIVQSIVKSNGLNVEVTLEGKSLKVTHKKENEEQAKSLVSLFSGKNPRNQQDLVADNKESLYLVNKGILFVADLTFLLEEEHLDIDSLDSILSDVLEEDNKKVQSLTADNFDAWLLLLTELRDSGHKYLHYIEDKDLEQVAISLQKLYNTEKAPLNKVLVTKFLEQLVAKEFSETFFLNSFVEEAYKELYTKNNKKLSTGYAVVMDKVQKNEHFRDLQFLSIFDERTTKKLIAELVAELALPKEETAKPEQESKNETLEDILNRIGVDDITIDDIKEYVEENKLENDNPSNVLDALYQLTQNKLKDVQETAYKRSGVKGRSVEKQVDAYMEQNYFGSKTDKKLFNVLEAYSLIQSMGSYTDWFMMLCENFIVGYVETGAENINYSEQEPEQETSQTEKMIDFLLAKGLELDEAKVILEYMSNVNPSDFRLGLKEIAKVMRIDIKGNKKGALDKLELHPAVSNKSKKLKAKMNKYLKETYLEDNLTTEINCLKFLANVKSTKSTVENEVYKLYKKASVEYDTKHQTELVSLMTNENNIDYVNERAYVTKVLRQAETDGSLKPHDDYHAENMLLEHYNRVLTEKVYAKSKDVITEYKKLFGKAK